MYVNNIIPFQKELKFDTKVKEITSISLEREFHVEEEEIKGNLFVTGDYKSHEISANVIPFSFKIPFTIAIAQDLEKESIQLEIHDFAYEMKENDQIQVSIELELSGNVKAEVEESSNEMLEFFEEPEYREKKDEILEVESQDEVIDKKEKIEENPVIVEEPDIILNQVSDENEYCTYHVHIVLDTDTIESICMKYQVSEDLIRKYNHFTELSKGDKLIIPVSHE